MSSFNRPQMRNENGDQQIRRYVHSPLTVEHNGINAAIKSNGKIVLTAVAKEQPDKDLVDYDEIEIPASLIFKLATLLKATRKVSYVSLSEMGTMKDGTAPLDEDSN